MNMNIIKYDIYNISIAYYTRKIEIPSTIAKIYYQENDFQHGLLDIPYGFPWNFKWILQTLWLIIKYDKGKIFLSILIKINLILQIIN